MMRTTRLNNSRDWTAAQAITALDAPRTERRNSCTVALIFHTPDARYSGPYRVPALRPRIP